VAAEATPQHHQVVRRHGQFRLVGKLGWSGLDHLEQAVPPWRNP
jgi:hypothetical protein